MSRPRRCPGLGDDGMQAISEIPEMLVFSSDFPHAEGNEDPIQLYADALAGHDAQRWSRSPVHRRR